jgi:hypothetical protein
VFVHDPGRFFTAIGNRPDTVTANISISSQRQSTSFTTSAKFKNADLCRVAIDTVVSGSGCSFSRAYAFFHSGYRPGEDELRIRDVQGTRANPTADVIYRNLPFAPSHVIASWNAASGTMMFQTTDNSSLDAGKWNAILQQVLYIPVSGVSGSKK